MWAQSPVVEVYPRGAVIRLPTGLYKLNLCSGRCWGYVDGSLQKVLDGSVLCASPGRDGALWVASDNNRKEQAEVLVHEVVHTADADCDTRDLPESERVAQAIQRLVDSRAGSFVVAELR